MTRLWILSDLHLEAVGHPDAFRPTPPAFDVLVTAGDIWQGDLRRGMAVVQRLAARRPAVLVLGNHEFWNHQIDRQRQAARLLAEQYDITLLDDDTTVLAGLRFVGGTLWGSGKLAGGDATPDLFTGERIVAGNGVAAHPITSRDQADLHRITRSMIAAAVAENDPRPLVVVTHHAPHPCCLPAAQRRGWIAGHSASDLSTLTDNGRVALWVHGHIHQTSEHHRPGGTRILCNAAGPRFGNPTFRDDWVVEVIGTAECDPVPAEPIKPVVDDVIPCTAEQGCNGL